MRYRLLLVQVDNHPKPHKEVFKVISQTVVIAPGTVNRIITRGVVGHS